MALAAERVSDPWFTSLPTCFIENGQWLFLQKHNWLFLKKNSRNCGAFAASTCFLKERSIHMS